MSQMYSHGYDDRYDDGFAQSAAYAPAQERAAFIRRTYLHVAGAILAFLGVEVALFQMFPGDTLMRFLFGSPYSLIFLMVAFIGSGYLARYLARSQNSTATKYLGLGLYVVVEAIIIYPLLWIAATRTNQPNLIPTAGIYTLCIFAALTGAAFITRKDFSFLGPIIMTVAFLMLGTILCGWLFGFNLGMWFSFLGIGLASAAILYNTSNIIHHYRTDEHVAAALELFAAIATLFYYILRVLLQSRSNN